MMELPPPHLPTAVERFLDAPGHDYARACLEDAMRAEGRDGWMARWPAAAEAVAGDAWTWMERALTAEAPQVYDYVRIIRCLTKVLDAQRTRARRRKEELDRRYASGSGPPGKAWWTDKDD